VRLGAGVLATSIVVTGAACGGAAPRPSTEGRYAEPHWQDVFEATPELLVVVRPTDLRRDKVYGPLLRRAIDLARQHSRVVAETRALDAMEDAAEVIIGMRPREPGSADDGAASEVVVVVRGVRADVDPGRLVDSDGHALWTAGPSGRVRELVRTPDRSAVADPTAPSAPALNDSGVASLFELPGRTWVIASGEARARARDAFAHPLGRPAIQLDPNALAIARIDGPALVRRIPALQTHGALAAVGHKLDSLTLELATGPAMPARGVRQVVATLSYLEEDAAALAEIRVREAFEALVRKRKELFAWLSTAKVDRPGKRVLVTAPLPPELVDGLLQADSAALDP
jgi:hypothetical protein